MADTTDMENERLMLEMGANDYSALGMTTKEVLVYEQIKQDIINNVYEPGTMLAERKLTEKYHVSRSPVRYALRQLVKDGLLTGEPGKGISVSVYTLEDILEVYDLLEVLQVHALQLALKNYNVISDARLEYIMEQTRNLTAENTIPERMEWDIRFHTFIIRSLKNKRLDMIFDMLVNQKRRFDTVSFGDVEHAHIATSQHEKIYEAIKARDVDASVAALREHEQYLKQYYIDKLVMDRYNI